MPMATLWCSVIPLPKPNLVTPRSDRQEEHMPAVETNPAVRPDYGIDAPNVLIANRGTEGRDHLVWPNHQQIESLLPRRDKVNLARLDLRLP